MTQLLNGVKSSRFKLLKIYTSITSNTLQEEIKRRKIPLSLADSYLKQALVLDRRCQRKYMALAFANSLGAYEITIPFPSTGTSIKAAIPVNCYSYIEGLNSNHLQIFRTIWDFLTWLTMNDDSRPRINTYILNGNKTIPQISKRLDANSQTISSVVHFLGNDDMGEKLCADITNICTSFDIPCGAQNYLYADFQNLSDYWTSQENAQKIWPVN